MALLLHRALQHGDHVVGANRRGHMNRQTFAGEFIQDTQGFEEAAIGQPIKQDVIGPDVIAMRGLVGPFVAAKGPRAAHARWLHGKSLLFPEAPGPLERSAPAPPRGGSQSADAASSPAASPRAIGHPAPPAASDSGRRCARSRSNDRHCAATGLCWSNASARRVVELGSPFFCQHFLQPFVRQQGFGQHLFQLGVFALCSTAFRRFASSTCRLPYFCRQRYSVASARPFRRQKSVTDSVLASASRRISHDFFGCMLFHRVRSSVSIWDASLSLYVVLILVAGQSGA